MAITTEDLYREILGRESDPEGLANWNAKFGAEISPQERTEFIRAAQPEAEQRGINLPDVDPLQNLYRNVLGREASAEEINSWGFGDEIDAGELDRFLGPARNEVVETRPTTGAVGKMAQQILDQNTSSKWGGEGYGSAQKNAYDMAALLAGQGFTDINQFGKISVPTDAAVTPVRGQKSMYDPELGNYMAEVITGYKDASGKDVDPSLVRTEYDDAGNFSYIAPVDSKEVFGNKATNQPISSYYDKAKGDVWGGTFAGEGSTAYGVQFAPDGSPIFYSKYGGSSNDLANLMESMGPVGQIALAVATGGLSIPQQIAAQMAMQVLSGGDLKDAVKGAALSFAASKIPGLGAVKEGASYLSGIDPSGTLSRAFTGAVTSGGGALLSGKDIGDAMLAGATSGGVSGAVNALTGSIEGFSRLNPAQQRMVSNAVTDVISGKPLDQAVINTAISFAKNEINSLKAPNSFDFEEGYFEPGGEGYFAPPTYAPDTRGYFDEISGRFIPDEGGALNFGDLTNETSGTNIGSMDGYKYNQNTGNWTMPDGTEIDTSYMQNSRTPLTGRQVLDNAGAVSPTEKQPAPVKPGATAKPGATGSGADLNALMSLLGGGQAAPMVVSSGQDNSADIELMQDIFGTDLSAPPAGDIDTQTRELARLMRS
jgi:hypothetical protein